MKRLLIAATTLLLMTAPAFAHNGPPPSAPPAGDLDHGDGGHDFAGGGLLVASDGTVFVTHEVVDTTAKTVTTQITAIRSTGATAWTATIPGREHLVLSGSNLISLSEAQASDGTITSTLTALSTATGTQAWTRTLSGRVSSLTPFNGGTYAVVVTPATTSGGTASRSLVAIGNDGSVLWTVALP